MLLLLPLALSTLLIWGDLPIDSRPDNDVLYVAGFTVFESHLRQEGPLYRPLVDYEF